MSNLLYMDETNGNGIYATKGLMNSVNNSNMNMNANGNVDEFVGGGGGGGVDNIINNTTSSLTATSSSTSSTNGTPSTPSKANNLNSMMNSAVRSAAQAQIPTNDTMLLPTSISNEDLSQSLSEYTDADESISAPTEFLAEFLSAVMLKDYKKALKYCKLILQYEPNNITAKEFYPLILDKLRGTASSDSDENYNKSSSPDPKLDFQSSNPSAEDIDDGLYDDQMLGDVLDGADIDDGNSSDELNNLSSSCSAGLSLSDSDANVDDDVEDEEDDDDDDVDDDIDDDDDDDVMSSSGDDLPIDDQPECGSGDDGGGGGAADNISTHNGSNSSRNSSSGGASGSGRSRSDNTTHSYSSLLLEEDDDIVPLHLQFTKELPSPDLDVSNGNKLPSTSCSDSESPTEPLTQRLAAILRSKCGVSNAKVGSGGGGDAATTNSNTTK